MRARPPKPLRVRLWPTRGQFEQSHRELIEELAHLRTAVGGLATDYQELAAHYERLAADQERLLSGPGGLMSAQETVRGSIEQLLDGQAEIRTRLRRTQALTARAYEALHDWPTRLDSARAERAYAEASPAAAPAMPAATCSTGHPASPGRRLGRSNTYRVF